MTKDGICFEKANVADLQSIWLLLHADSRLMKEEQILERINEIYILRYRQRILGALCGNYRTPGRVVIDWVVIHPIYPESALREAMISEFSAVLCREPDISPYQSSLFRQWIKRCKTLNKGPFYIRTEGV